MKNIVSWLIPISLGAAFVTSLATASSPGGKICLPTPPDMLGPFYTSGAPLRSSVGKGYVLAGTVRSSAACFPITKARIEFWLTGPDGQYGDDYRATMFSDTSGTYRFWSNSPKPYFGRPPHIHIRVTVDGYRTLVTQHYPEPGTSKAEFDLVLTPEK
ncbi:MAG TPA: intradiol ring-cleavage dioxygenase [Nitrospiraceae bacterium]|nr:intradiol ring-cleavage dioxygenase [Nitrospiraceae bacterium]